MGRPGKFLTYAGLTIGEMGGSNLGRARDGCCGGVYAGGLDESEFPDEKNLLIPNMIPLRCGVRFSVAMGLSFVKMQSRKFAKPSATGLPSCCRLCRRH